MARRQAAPDPEPGSDWNAASSCKEGLDALSRAWLALDATRWFFWRGLIPVAIVPAIAIWGFRNVLGKQALPPEGALEG